MAKKTLNKVINTFLYLLEKNDSNKLKHVIIQINE